MILRIKNILKSLKSKINDIYKSLLVLRTFILIRLEYIFYNGKLREALLL